MKVLACIVLALAACAFAVETEEKAAVDKRAVVPLGYGLGYPHPPAVVAPRHPLGYGYPAPVVAAPAVAKVAYPGLGYPPPPYVYPGYPGYPHPLGYPYYG